MMTRAWHYILTLGTYPDGEGGPLRLRTFEGTMIAGATTGRAEMYQHLRKGLAKEHPDLAPADAVVIHSDIQPTERT